MRPSTVLKPHSEVYMLHFYARNFTTNEAEPYMVILRMQLHMNDAEFMTRLCS